MNGPECCGDRLNATGIMDPHCFCLPGDPVSWRMRMAKDMDFSCCWCGEQRSFTAVYLRDENHGPNRRRVEWVPSATAYKV